jgi:hypothetical protein
MAILLGGDVMTLAATTPSELKGSVDLGGTRTFTVADGKASGTFVLVRAQAKLEPPLISLRGGGGQIAISTIAQVTFYGRDQTGNDVSVSGSIGVNFADWGDPSTESSGS